MIKTSWKHCFRAGPTNEQSESAGKNARESFEEKVACKIHNPEKKLGGNPKAYLEQVTRTPPPSIANGGQTPPKRAAGIHGWEVTLPFSLRSPFPEVCPTFPALFWFCAVPRMPHAWRQTQADRSFLPSPTCRVTLSLVSFPPASFSGPSLFLGTSPLPLSHAVRVCAAATRVCLDLRSSLCSLSGSHTQQLTGGDDHPDLTASAIHSCVSSSKPQPITTLCSRIQTYGFLFHFKWSDRTAFLLHIVFIPEVHLGC